VLQLAWSEAVIGNSRTWKSVPLEAGGASLRRTFGVTRKNTTRTSAHTSKPPRIPGVSHPKSPETSRSAPTQPHTAAETRSAEPGDRSSGACAAPGDHPSVLREGVPLGDRVARSPRHRVAKTPDHWITGSLDHWITGSLDHGDTGHRVTESPSHRVTGSPEHRGTGTPGRGSTETPAHSVAGSPGHQVTRSPGHRVTGSPGRGDSGSPDTETSRHRDTGTSEEAKRRTRGTPGHRR